MSAYRQGDDTSALREPPGRPVKWLVRTSDDHAPLGQVTAQTWFEARAIVSSVLQVEYSAFEVTLPP